MVEGNIFEELEDNRQDWKVWKGLAAFGKCESRVTRMKSGKESIETRYFITTLSDVEEFARAVRSHWAIEDNLHWSLDVLFLDDDCPVLDRNTIVISVGRNNCRK